MVHLEIFTKTKKIIKDEDGEGIATEYSVHPVAVVLICIVCIAAALFFV